MRYIFDSIEKLLDYVGDKTSPSPQMMSNMNIRELTRLRINGVLIMGVRCSFQQGVLMRSVDQEACHLESFLSRVDEIKSMSNWKITNYYCYIPSHDYITPIILEHSSVCDFNQQLFEYTGDPMEVEFFHNQESDDQLDTSGIVVHRSTGQRFNFPSI